MKSPDEGGLRLDIPYFDKSINFLLKSNQNKNGTDKMAHGNQRVSDREIVQVFERADAPYMTAGEVAEELSISRQASHSRLMNLYERGTLERKKTGRTVGWWLNNPDG